MADGEAADTGRQSLAVSAWTLVSRVTGLGRVVVVAAVLGPTYLGNTFEAVNLIPNLTFELFTGSVLRSLLVPALVRSLHAGDREETERLAGSFLGLTLAAFAVITLVTVVAGPLILGILSGPVPDQGMADAQQRAGLLLLFCVMPQVVLYGAGGVGSAVLNARGRFGLAAAAPALENICLMATMGVLHLMLQGDTSLEGISSGRLVFLGLGSTFAVLLHTGTQVFWAHRVGLRITPRRGWTDPALRPILKAAAPSLGYSALNVAGVSAAMVVANGVAGGVVAFDLAWYLMYFPVAVIARPLGVALLPRLSTMVVRGELEQFRAHLARGISMSIFVVVPASAVYILLSGPVAEAVAFGEMARPEGLRLLTVSIASLGLGVLGESLFFILTQAHYARGDVRSPLSAMVIRTAVLLGGSALALSSSDDTVLIVLGLAVSSANVAGALYSARRLTGEYPGAVVAVVPSFVRSVVASVPMVVIAGLVISQVQENLGGHPGAALGMVAGTIGGLATYIAVQYALRSPDVQAVRATLAQVVSGR